MGIEKTVAQMRKGVLELCVLRVLRSGEAYASDVANALRTADLLVVEGTLYPLLTRMKNSGSLQYRWEESSSGPPRKYYDLTEDGKKLLVELDAEWLQFTASVNAIGATSANKQKAK
jgi:PadR family transcriptional regulator PadR